MYLTLPSQWAGHGKSSSSSLTMILPLIDYLIDLIIWLIIWLIWLFNWLFDWFDYLIDWFDYLIDWFDYLIDYFILPLQWAGHGTRPAAWRCRDGWGPSWASPPGKSFVCRPPQKWSGGSSPPLQSEGNGTKVLNLIKLN